MCSLIFPIKLGRFKQLFLQMFFCLFLPLFFFESHIMYLLVHLVYPKPLRQCSFSFLLKTQCMGLPCQGAPEFFHLPLIIIFTNMHIPFHPLLGLRPREPNALISSHHKYIVRPLPRVIIGHASLCHLCLTVIQIPPN